MPDMSAPARLASRMAVCMRCNALFLLPPGHLMTQAEPLPCGHTLSLYFGEADLMNALRDAVFLEWAHRRGLLDGPMDALHAEGGVYSPFASGPGRLHLPGGAL